MRTRAFIAAAILLACAASAASADAAGSASRLVVSGGANTEARLHLSRSVVLGEDAFSLQHVAGPDGTFTAVVVRDTGRRIVFARVLGRVATSRNAVIMDPFGAARLKAGDYTVELLGDRPQAVSVQATGLARSVQLSARGRSKGRLSTVQYGSRLTGGATVDRVTVPNRAAFVFQLQGSHNTIGPHEGGAALCSVSAGRCAEQGGVGSENDFSGPSVGGVHVATDGNRFAYYTYRAADVPSGELLSEQDAATPHETWRAVLALQ